MRLGFADVALLLTALAALAALPPEQVPWQWVAGYAVPAVLLLGAQRLLPRLQAVTVGVATLALLGIGATLRALVPTGDAAPIACILVAPLAYFCLRRQPGDHRYALFLALCVLVIGSVLDLSRSRGLAILFAIGATLTLWHDSASAARTIGRGPRAGTARRRSRAWHATGITALTLFTALSLFQLLTIAPVPNRGATSEIASDDARRRKTVQGLSEHFDLSATDGWLEAVNDLRAPHLLAVRRDDGPTPQDLYLRLVHFDLAGANRWATAKFMARAQPTTDAWTLLEPEAGWRTVAYQIEREPLANGHLFLPEGTWRVQDVNDLEGHEESGLLREPRPSSETLTYRALTLVRTSTSPRLRIDPRARHLLSLPEGLIEGDVARLAERYGEGTEDDVQRAATIARHLQRNYHYTRRDPTGPWPDALHNFLFHTKAGYCMHFASALAVMLRLQRIPCRIGGGLYGGHDDERAGWRAYGAADAHAWVEIPCIGVGWVVLDATPGEARAASNRDRADVPAPDVAMNARLEPSDESASDAITTARWSLAVLFLAGIVLVPGLRRAAPAPGLAGQAVSPAAHPAGRLLTTTLSHLARVGILRRRDETLAHLAARADRALEIEAGALFAAFRAYEDVRFGGTPFGPEHAERLRAGAGAAAIAKLRTPESADRSR